MPRSSQIRLHGREVRRADVAEMIEDRRQLVDDRLVFRHLAIEHAQRIGFGAALAIAAQLRRDGLQRFAQFLDELRPAIRIADGIDQQREIRRARRA